MGRITITISLNETKHAKLITWLKRHPDGYSAAVRDAIEAQVMRSEFTLADVMQRLDEIERRGIAIAQPAVTNNGDEPVEAAMALEGLGV